MLDLVINLTYLASYLAPPDSCLPLRFTGVSNPNPDPLDHPRSQTHLDTLADVHYPVILMINMYSLLPPPSGDCGCPRRLSGPMSESGPTGKSGRHRDRDPGRDSARRRPSNSMST